MAPPRIDICYCLDTTGSMSDEIQVVKESILEIAAAIENGTPRPIVRFSLVIFRDIGDAYVTQVFDFMSASELEVVMRNVSARAGGDYPESVSEALHRSVHEVAWDLEADRAIYLIGDAPPHTDYDNGFDHRQAALDAAAVGIMINAIGCSGIRGSEVEFMQVAEITGGEFVYLSYTSSAGGGYEGDGGGGGCGWGEDDGPGGVGGVPDRDGEGAGSGTGSSGGTGSGTGSGQGQSNNLDDVLAGMGQGQGQRKGVTYEDEEVAGEDGGSSDSGTPGVPSSPPPGLRRV